MKKLYTFQYRHFLAFIILEAIILFFIAHVLNLYDKDGHWTAFLLILTFNIVIATLFYRVHTMKTSLLNALMERQRCEFIEQELQNYRKHRHDMKNHLMVIYELARQGELEELKEYVETYSSSVLTPSLVSVNTGLDELNVLFMSKIEWARKQQITFQFHCSTKFVTQSRRIPTLVSLMANLLDNAIEAAHQVDDPENRMVSVTLSADPLDIIAVFTNTFSPNQTPNLKKMLKDGYSQKAPDRGRGLSIVQNIAKKLDGRLSIDLYEERFFQIKLEIPKHRLL